MSDTQTVPISELEELLDAEIPCGGYPSGSGCPNSAMLISYSHPNCPQGPPFFKCLSCYTKFITSISVKLALGVGVRCKHCKQVFTSIAKFSDYRLM